MMSGRERGEARGMRLKDRVAIVTGSTAGIGRATAELFAAEGARVVVCGRRKELGEEVVDGIEARGGTAAFLQVDVSSGAELERLVGFAVETFGGPDVLMNNAYSGRSTTVTEMGEDDWDQAFAVTVKAAALASRCAIPHMIAAGGGSIIHVASVHGVLASRANAPYNALKAALINLARQMAMDYGRHNIRVNALCPGRIVTEAKVEFLEAHPEQKVLQKLVYPLGRPGTMKECASAALFLASDDSSFVTGHALMVDGGLTAQLADAVGTYVEAALRKRG
jgi:NAD(P)-dependent dehydrogenase (short-subunit alcohol dehydrogenase family)